MYLFSVSDKSFEQQTLFMYAYFRYSIINMIAFGQQEFLVIRRAISLKETFVLFC